MFRKAKLKLTAVVLILGMISTLFGNDPVVFAASGSSGASTKAYIASFNTDTVDVVDLTTHTVEKGKISVGTEPNSATINPNGTQVLVTNRGSDTVSVINPATDTVVATIPVGDRPHGVVFTTDGSKAYVANYGSDTLSVINTATNAVTGTINVSGLPVAMVVIGQKLYLTQQGADQIAVINLATDTVTSQITVGDSPYGLSTNPAGTKIYVANQLSRTVSVINVANNTVEATISVGSRPSATVVSPDGGTVYVANTDSDTVSVIDAATNTVVDIIQVGTSPYTIGVSTDGSKAYAINFTSSNLSVIDTATNTVIQTIGLSNGPYMVGPFMALKAAVPTANPAGSAVASGTAVALSSSTVGAAVYYTTDGSTPTASSTLYSAPIIVTSAITIKAIAVMSGMRDSAVMSESYTINTLDAPVISASAVGDGHATISWSPLPGATSYKVYKSTSPGSYGAAEATVGSSVYSSDFTGLTNGTTYYFVVRAANGGTESSHSNEVSATPQSSTADLKALTTSAGSLSPDFSSGVTSYEVTVPYNTRNLSVTGTVYDSASTLKVNDETTVSGAAYADIPLTLGANTISLEVTSGDGTTQKTYTLVVTRNPSSSGGGSSTTVPLSNGMDVIVDGIKQEKFATTREDKIGDQTATIVTVDNDKVIAKLEQEGKLLIMIKGTSDVVITELNGKLVDAMENKDAIIEIETDRATYSLPASQLKIDSLLSQFGTHVKLEDIKLNIKIGASTATTEAIVRKHAVDNGYTVVVSPVDFEITASYGDKQVDVSQFRSYVERWITLPDGIDASQMTTGVVLNADGSLSHVPTKVVIKDGKAYAVINSLTNSTYSVVFSPKTFPDVESHWSKRDVNDMASRLIVQGVTDQSYQPDKAITRAEFVSIIVRALGLKPDAGAEAPKDIQVSDWFASTVKTAVSYGLISGYEDGTFRPHQTITRQEAAVIVAHALTIVNLNVGISAEEATQHLSSFKDGASVAAWAKKDMAAAVEHRILQGNNGKISPNDNVSRAQTAAMMRRLLQKADLIISK